MEELKPCPFCGGEAEIIDYEYEYDVYDPDTFGYVDTAQTVLYAVVCEVCKVGVTEKHTKEEAVKAWNTRAERTCHMERVFLYDEECVEGIECSECGWSGEHSHIKSLPEYCPSCGAKVVNE